MKCFLATLRTTAELRETVSVWLRARGYASDTDFGQSTELTPETDTIQPLSSDKSPRLENDTADSAHRLASELRDLPPDSELLPQQPQPDSELDEKPLSASETLDNRKLQDKTAVRPPTPRRPAQAQRIPEPPSTDKIDVLTASIQPRLTTFRPSVTFTRRFRSKQIK